MPIDNHQLTVLMLIPFGFFVLYLMGDFDQKPDNPSESKEANYLRYNKDEVFKNLLAAEGHFRNVEENGVTAEKGFLACTVKHLADAESHLDEAISHSTIVGDSPEKFKNVRDRVRVLRHDLQDGDLTASEGIRRVREARHEFESFNPEFDISKCKGCEIVG